MTHASPFCLSLLAGLCAAAPAFAIDTVVDWNGELLNSIVATSTAPPPASRAMAMTQLAVFEAVNSIDRSYIPYRQYYDAAPGTNKDAAAATAAHGVLASLFPSRIAALDAKLASSLAAIPDGAGKSAGILLGQTAASNMLASRASDGSNIPTAAAVGSAPGEWRPVGSASPLNSFAAFKSVTPFGLSSPNQFRPASPPDLSSAQYAAEVNEVKRLGGATSIDRTPEQSEIARMWAMNAGTVTPPGSWNQIAQQSAISASLTIDQSARLFALLGMAEADAAVAAWDCKNMYNLWRPITAIQLADTDGNAATEADPSWVPYIGTPNFQAYTSGHSTFSAAAATVLTNFFGTDSAAFSVTSAGITRSFTSYQAAAEEAGISRIYGGIHFASDNTEGLTCGAAVGAYAFNNYLQVPAPGAMALLGLGGIMAARRRRE